VPNDEDVNDNRRGMAVVMVDVVIVAASAVAVAFPPLPDKSYHLVVLPPPLLLQRGKD
jgi:hypothetical protein